MENNQQVLQKIRQHLPDKNQKEYFEIHSFRYLYLLDYIATLNLPQSSAILDIGCYPPHLFNSLSELGYKTFGISSEHEKISLKNVKTANIEINPLPFDDDSFDLILFSEVLEHLSKSPKLLFSEIRRVLKPNGLLLLTTPNAVRSQNLFRVIFSRNFYFPIFQLSENVNHRHNREFILSELNQLAQDADLKIVKSSYFVSYSPFREKNRFDKLPLKIVKLLNYYFMVLFPNRRDTLLLLAQK